MQSARLAVEHDPADAARALAEAERLGRECLAEVRTTVGMLRQDGPDDRTGSTAPLPGADGLPALVEQFRSAGADVTVTVEGDTGGLPATTGLALYRILQEALTNAVKHAPGACELEIVVDEGQIAVRVHDTGRALPVERVPDITGTGGFGMVMLRRIAGAVTTSARVGGKTVSVTIPRTAAR